jgi:hypothetical protein
MTKIQEGIYQHYKGKRYEVVGQAMHSETLEVVVIYKALYQGDFSKDMLWVRPLTMFQENVVVNGQSVPRFRYVTST